MWRWPPIHTQAKILHCLIPHHLIKMNWKQLHDGPMNKGFVDFFTSFWMCDCECECVGKKTNNRKATQFFWNAVNKRNSEIGPRMQLPTATYRCLKPMCVRACLHSCQPTLLFELCIQFENREKDEKKTDGEMSKHAAAASPPPPTITWATGHQPCFLSRIFYAHILYSLVMQQHFRYVYSAELKDV